MSANVAFGEKITPTRRPNGEIEAWGSAKGADAVAIVDSLQHRLQVTVQGSTQDQPEKYHTLAGWGISGTAARSSRV
jgi:hypothetical protein